MTIVMMIKNHGDSKRLTCTLRSTSLSIYVANYSPHIIEEGEGSLPGQCAAHQFFSRSR
jgi:hypothetical protein